MTVRTNKAFQRALNSLAHPLSISAVVLLLLNDRLLRPLWPSWWTGKIGDAAWLMFAPFVVTALLACFISSQWRRQEDIVGWGALVATGFGFALAKTFPAIHLLTVGVMERIVGWDVRWLRDPGDLIVLPALLVAWQVWKHTEARPRAGPAEESRPMVVSGELSLRGREASEAIPSNPKWRLLGRLRRLAMTTRADLGLVVLTLAVLATLADAPAPDYGISCLKQDGAKIVAAGGYGSSFVSEDGGLTWRAGDNTGAPSGDCGQQGTWEMDDPANARVKYRFAPGAEIARSEDGGETWKSEVNLHQAEEARAAFQRKNTYYEPTPGPADALIDPQTGNVVVAMRHEGVLVRDKNGRWSWIAVGSYDRYEPRSPNDILYLVSGELWFALPLAFLVVNTLARPARTSRRRLWDVLLGAGWVLWGFVLIGLQPAMSNWGYLEFPVSVFMLVVAAIALAGGIVGAVQVFRWSPRAFVPIGATAVIAALLYFLPYLLWAFGALPRYWLATLFAWALVAATLFAGYRSLPKSP